MNRVGRSEGESLTPYKNSGAQQEEERVLFFPGKNSANEKPWTLCLLSNILQLFFISVEAFSFPYHVGGLGCRPPKCNSLLVLNKPIFAGEICGNLLSSGQ